MLLHNFDFSIAILSDIGPTDEVTKDEILAVEQMYIDLYKPKLNTHPTAGSSLGFKHKASTKELMSQMRKGKKLSNQTKAKLIFLFTDNIDKTSHAEQIEVLQKVSEIIDFDKYPHYASKSKEFLYYMFKSKKGVNNPMYGTKKSQETLLKIRKPIYIYNSNKELINSFEKTIDAAKLLKIGAPTLKKYKDTGKLYKGIYIYSKLLD